MGCIWSHYNDGHLAQTLRDTETALRHSDDIIKGMRDTTAELERMQRFYECKICFTGHIESVLLPCGHCVACKACTVPICERGVCPICNASVETVTHIFVN